MWVDAVGLGECELGEGLFPVGGDLSFDQAAGGSAVAELDLQTTSRAALISPGISPPSPVGSISPTLPSPS